MALKIGIIGEDESDVDVARHLIERSSGKKIQSKHRVGKGCGKLRENLRRWSETLKLQGCTRLVVLHDLDDFEQNELRQLLAKAIEGIFPNKHHTVVVPVRELEAWLLADIAAIKSALSLKNTSGDIPNPESLLDPKKELSRRVELMSKKERLYIHTVDNPRIALKCSVDRLRKKCKSFEPLYCFARTQC